MHTTTPKTETLKRLAKKIAIAYSLIFLSWLGFVVAGKATAYFSDMEKSVDNVLAAGVLSMDVVGNGILAEEMRHSQLASVEILVTDAGDVPFLHGFVVTSEGELCQYLNISAKYTGEKNWEKKDAPLVDFSSDFIFATGTWELSVVLPKINKRKTGECSFAFEFRAAQDNGNDGYWDKKTIENWFGTGVKIEPLRMMQEPLLDAEILPIAETLPLENVLEQEKSELPAEENIETPEIIEHVDTTEAVEIPEAGEATEIPVVEETVVIPEIVEEVTDGEPEVVVEETGSGY